MNKKISEGKFVEAILPYLILGISIAVAVSLIVIFFYLFMWGVIIGFVLWAIMVIKEKFFSTADKNHYHKVLHVEEDGSVVVEEDRLHASSKPKKRTPRGDK